MASNNTVVVITPDGITEQFKEANSLMGYSFGQVVPLSTDGNDPATHYGSHSWMTDNGAAYVQLPSGRPDTPPREGETEPAYTGAEVDDLYAASAVSVNPVLNPGEPDEVALRNNQHFEWFATSQALQKIVPEEPPQGETVQLNRIGDNPLQVLKDAIEKVEPIVDQGSGKPDLYVVYLKDGRKFPLIDPDYEDFKELLNG